MGHGRLPPRPHPAEALDRGPDQRVAGMAPVELARVVVERKHEACVLDRPLARGADDDASVVELLGRGPAAAGELRAATERCQRLVGASTDPSARSTASTIEPAYWPPRTRYFHAMRLADAISLRSRRRKLQLFLDELRPDAETSVLDVGADELGFGDGDGCGTLNFFEEHYPWPERITALGLHDGAGFRDRYPGSTTSRGMHVRSRSWTARSTSCSRTR